MRRLMLICIVVIVTCVLLGYYTKTLYKTYKIGYDPFHYRYENYYDYFIQKIRYEQGKAKVIEDTIQHTLNFDASNYIKAFDYLEVDEGWALDCYYYFRGDAGWPILFIRKTNVDRDSLIKSFELCGNGSYFKENKLKDHIRIKNGNNELACFQWLIFDLIGDDFAKFWHAGYGEFTIIHSRKIIDKIKGFHNGKMGPKLNIEVRSISWVPVIKEYKECFTIQILVFNSWHGFVLLTYKIDKHYPNEIKLINDKLIYKFDCGIMY